MTTYVSATSPSLLTIQDVLEARAYAEERHARQHKGMLCPDLDCRICERRAADQKEILVREMAEERM